MQFTNRAPWSPRFPGITKQCFLVREHNDSAARLATLVRFAKTLRGRRASITQQESDLRCVLKQVKPRQATRTSEYSTGTPKQVQPTPSPFKTLSNPPQPIQSMVKPSQTHPKPTPNPPQTHPLLSAPSKHGHTHSKPTCTTLSLGMSPFPKIFFFIGRMATSNPGLQHA